jgi:hypothetical protein
MCEVVSDWLYYYFREFSCMQAMLRLVTSKINVTVLVCKSELLSGNINFAANRAQNLLNGSLWKKSCI